MHPLVIRVDNRIRFSAEGVDEDVLAEIRRECEHDNPAFHKARALGYSTYRVPAILKTWRKEAGGEYSFPRGAMGRIRRTLKNAGIPFRVIDARVEGSFFARPLKYIGHQPREYQYGATEAVLLREQGVIRAATGSGKTTTALYLASRIGLNALIVLPSVKLLKQTVEVALPLLGIKGDQVGILQGPKRRLRPLTVATQQTLWSRSVDPEVRDFFGAVMIDEAHHAAARTFAEVVDQFPARYRVAFTADERRKDKMEFLVYDAFGDVLHETTREECEASGAVVDVEIRILLTDFRADWYRDAESNEKDFGRLVDEMVESEERNTILIENALEEIGSGKQVLILTHRREHARAIDRALVNAQVRSGLMLGGAGADANEFDRTKSGIKDGSVRSGIGTYEALGEGIDLPAVEVGFASTPIAKNKQRMNQVRGRFCRPADGKSKGILYVLFDRYVFDEQAYRNILAWNKTVTIRNARGVWIDARTALRDGGHSRAILSA